MHLTRFIQQLLINGSVMVDATDIKFNKADDETALLLLHTYYEEDIQDIPLTALAPAAPAFDEAAVLWAAKYLYAAVYFTVVREAVEDTISKHLTHYNAASTRAVAYSTDLMFRHLPALLKLASGLAPSDILVLTISEELKHWPLSAPALEHVHAEEEAVVLNDPALKIMYLDRLIAARNARRIIAGGLQDAMAAITGDHFETFWPGAAITFKTTTE